MFLSHRMTDICCECPYNGFCKHSAAVLLTLKALFGLDGFKDRKIFVSVQKNVFWNTVSHSCDRIEL